MSLKANLPGARQAIVEAGGTPSRPLYTFLQRVATTLDSLSASSGDVTIPELPISENANVVGKYSIYTRGTLKTGIVSVLLIGDVETPGATQYYGSNGEGTRGWYAVSDALAGSSNVTLTVGADGVTTFDLADLPDTGTGAALVKITRDSKGRVAGTSAATTDDLLGTDQHPYAVAVQATATIDLGSPRVVAVADGQAYYPDLSDGVDAQRIAGVTVASVAAGEVATIRPSIRLTNALWSWSPGPIYCGPLGTITQAAPSTGALVEIGRALDATTVLISIHRAILR